MSSWKSPLELPSNASSFSSITPIILSAFFPRNSYIFVLVGSPHIPQLQALAKTYPNPALPLPSPGPIVLKKKNREASDGELEMVETVYLRPRIDTLYLPLLETLDIEHFIECQGNHVLKEVALLVGDIESLSIPPAPLSPAAQIIFGLPQLETVYAVECGEVGKELRQMLSFREREPDLQWDMLEVPEIVAGPPPGDAMDMFGGYTYPSKAWDKKMEALVKKNWEEKMAGQASPKPRLQCRHLQIRLPRPRPPVM
ncbi:hypothetical protein NA56DRAFT_216915 [Hyaloscypha hepaticicola]|uniref:Uncharacterized protein n=1 Tax=Hyaloscypha hepaticicola TaxID=2082293 RepID=A0A2J6PZ48_9HELO|nr:hypothetical protein NA56DRAFT_216915 [Hyaloscypha hepaticicola]